MAKEILLPNLGDGVAGGTVSTVVAKVGDVLGANDTLLELETDKAVIPVPIGLAGTLVEIKVKAGQALKVGDAIAALDAAGSAAAPAKASPPPAAAKVESAAAAMAVFVVPNLGDGIEKGTVATLVAAIGSEVKKGDTLFEIETDKAVVPVPCDFNGKIEKFLVQAGQVVKVGDPVLEFFGAVATSSKASPASASAAAPAPVAAKAAPAPAPKAASISAPVIAGPSIPAGPATRKLARELGVDLSKVGGSARGGRITLDDLKSFVKSAMQGGGGARAPLTLPDFSVFGNVRREPMARIRKIVSERLGDAWNRIPHVHQFQDIDVTELTEYQKKHADAFKEKGSALSVTLFLIKGLAEGIRKFPAFASSIDEARSEIIYKDYANIGVAVDTPDGLVVPVLKGVDAMSVFEIGVKLKEIAKKARDKKLMPADMQGACITLSNLGGIGGTHFNPIVNPPEVAILGAGRTRVAPVWKDGAFVPRQMLPVVLGYDHRVIDGADGARFTMFLTSFLENWVADEALKSMGLPR